MATATARLLTAYRETLRRCRFLGGERGRATRLDAQRFFGEARALRADDAAAAEAHLAQAASRLSFLRMLTPRYAGAASASAADGDAAMAGGTFVCRDGKLVSSAALREGKARHSQWDGGNLDPDSVRKYRQLLSASTLADPLKGRSPRRLRQIAGKLHRKLRAARARPAWHSHRAMRLARE